MPVEYKICTNAQLKVLDTGSDGSSAGRIAGYASTYANWDRVNERPVKGAFAGSIEQFKRDGFIALDHDWTKRIATVDIAREDDYGLWIEADFHSTPDAQQERVKTMERLDRRKSVSFSIGYEVLGDEYVEEGRLLKDIRLYEVSLVSVPANPLALVAGAKGGGLVDGLPMSFTDQLDAVVDAVEGLTGRAKARADLRLKEGRVLSAANRSKLGDLKTSLAELITMLEEVLATSESPQKNTEHADEVRKELARFLKWEAQMNGVIIP